MARGNKIRSLVTFVRATRAFLLSVTVNAMALASTQQTKQPEATKPAGPPQSGGASTGGVFAPVMDEKHRPITAGGFVDGAPVIFVDHTKRSGLDKFRHVSGSPEKN